ncbi:uncharacterized protein LAESUDRAFT_762489 [Laetiporus sulphureus 93-53]|uniref:Uncharacterized protein n=1 Tax=Laetiporus sulphureus 93-53 TaxID=1314785 RepID=A0A165CHP6_9APHY|nr:uncharacterized protein LAESUDRAFT_762489 [Laetiporus sulphureus 93-53]KZT02835.1 hypothetical protein LAESUDRAFT_762489 [Laetiporus sulphureus 93-53]
MSVIRGSSFGPACTVHNPGSSSAMPANPYREIVDRQFVTAREVAVGITRKNKQEQMARTASPPAVRKTIRKFSERNPAEPAKLERTMREGERGRCLPKEEDQRPPYRSSHPASRNATSRAVEHRPGVPAKTAPAAAAGWL